MDVIPEEALRDGGYRRGDDGYRRITTALFAAGMATFISMYAAQAVLPELSDTFAQSPARSALAVSATTGLLAFSIVPASILSERFGRTRIMSASAIASAVIGLIVPLMPTMNFIIAARAIQGVTLAGVPAVAMAYLAEEVASADLGAAMGRYIAGTTVGGLAGRLAVSSTLGLLPWRWSLEVAALLAVAFTVWFSRSAPASRYFTPQPINPRASFTAVAYHLRNMRVMVFVALAFLLMGGFVSIYNLLGFRLLKAPFSLPEGVVGLVFLMYLAGTFSSAWAGRLSDRIGRAQVLMGSMALMAGGLLLTWPNSLVLILIGMLLFTAGFFGAHSTASSWVGSMATKHRAQASSLYLFGYYTGSSVVGAVAGIPYAKAGWNGAIAFVGAATGIAFVLGLVVMSSGRAKSV